MRNQLWKRLSVEKNGKKPFAYLELCTRQSYPVHTYLLQRLAPFILTPVSLQCLSGCFPLIFLEGHCLVSSSEKIVVIFLHLIPMTWKPLVSSKRTATFASILFWSCWRYSSLFLFFFSSIILLFLASSLILALAIFLAFWAICSTWWASATSSKWAWNCCFSSCFCYISQHYSLSILALF